MAISVSTDLIMDVVNAASPSKVANANAKLQSASASTFEVAAAGDKFTAELLVAKKATDPASDLTDLRKTFDERNQTEAHQKFEAMVLHQFVQQMLPSDTSIIFGEGTSGEIWKGMLAQQIGDALAKGGGIGIADKMLADRGLIDNVPNNANNIINNQELDILDTLLKTEPLK